MNPPDDFTPDEQDLINRLNNAPQLDLSPRAFDQIEQRILQNIPVPGIVKPWYANFAVPMAALLIVTVFISAVVIIAGPQLNAITPTSVPPVATLDTQPTAALSDPVSVVTITNTAQAMPHTSQPTREPSPQPTQPQPTYVLPSPTPVSANIVIEGPVQRIEGEILFVYNLPVQINGQQQEVFATLSLGNMVRIEGSFTYQDGNLVLIATVLENLEPPTPIPADPQSTIGGSNGETGAGSGEIQVNPNTGETWADTGNCSNPPPDWAPANGWRRRCQSSTSEGSTAPPANNGGSARENENNNNGNSGNNGNGRGNGG